MPSVKSLIRASSSVALYIHAIFFIKFLIRSAETSSLVLLNQESSLSEPSISNLMDNNINSKDKTTTTDDNNVGREQQQEEAENPNNNNGSEQQVVLEEETNNTNRSRGGEGTGRTPFTNLSQVDADLALARTLQEQERAYMMLRMNTDGSDYGSWEGGSYLHDDDEEDEDEEEDEDHFDATDIDDDDDDDVHVHDDDEDEQEDHHVIEDDTDAFSSDEAYARALQDAEEREMAARLLALSGINDPTQVEDPDDQAANSQDTWEEIDPDELSYEELLALGEVIGTESRGLSTDTIASLPTVIYKSGSSQNGSNDSCVICRLDYEDGETLTVLSCKHSYHSDCINNWLKINKVCPVCNAEVSTSGNSQYL